MMSDKLNTKRLNEIAGTNHDIKTLLNGVLCMSSLLEGTPLSIEQAEIVHLLKKSAEELEAIMTVALEKSKPDAVLTSPKKKSFKLTETLDAAFNTFRLTLQDKPIETLLITEGKVPATIKGDQSALIRILSNLLNNVGKFTQKGKIKLHVTAEKQLNNKVVITFKLKDTGIGIEKENIGKIFKHFTKFNSDGYGLGLATAKELVEQNGGAINVESTVGQGTTFTFSLPYEITHYRSSHKISPLSTAALKNNRILIVDDDEVYIKYLTTILKQCKTELTIVTNSHEALEKSVHQRFDIVMLDLHMPDMDGYEIAYQIRNTANINRHVALIGMTAGDIEKEKVIMSDMSDVFPKPLNAESLVNRLQKALTQRQTDFSSLVFNAKKSKKNFDFSRELNAQHLKELYGNDLEHATLMFKTFLTESLKEWYDILMLEKKDDFVTIRDKAHRLRPAFSMVGLTQVESLLNDFEKNFDRYSTSEIKNILLKIDTIVVQKIPIVEKESHKLKYAFTSVAA